MLLWFALQSETEFQMTSIGYVQNLTKSEKYGLASRASAEKFLVGQRKKD